MREPNRDYYRFQMQSIGRAIAAVKETRVAGVDWMQIDHALNALRLARLMAFVDYRKRLELWRQEATNGDNV